MATYRPMLQIPQTLLPAPFSSPLAEIVAFPAEAADLPEVLAALTYALDLAAHERPGHTLRSCILGMNLARRLHLDPSDTSALFYTLLLNSLGSARQHHTVREWTGMGERLSRHALRGFDWRRFELTRMRFLFTHAFREKAPVQKLLAIAGLLSRRDITPALQHRRSPAGIRLARTLNLPERTVQTMQAIDERWDGTGAPLGLAFEATSLLAQVARVAQDLAAFNDSVGRGDAVRIIEGHSGRWYDPAVVVAAITTHESGTLWTGTDQEDLLAEALARHPKSQAVLCDDEALEAVCSAVAEVIDGRSEYTARHSHGVANVAAAIGTEMNLTERERKTLHCAALLHDIGKLSVPAEILDATGPLTPTQMSSVRRSPLEAYAILRRIKSFESIALLAKTHHERLDGSGYPEGFAEHQISRLSRILAMAEAYDSLSSPRPYRNSFTQFETLALLEAEIPQALDAATFEALKRALKQNSL